MKTAENRRFVIQQHTTPDGVHWDLMLERGGVLWTWRLDTAPSDINDTPVAAERIFDHPLRFLTYEGPVQNNTGNVQIADLGSVQYQSIESDQISCKLEGNLLKGDFLLRQDHSSNWYLERQTEKP